jgi:hypothetical protein
LSPQCILPLLFSLSVCIPFALSFYCPSFSIFMLLVPLLYSAAVFCSAVFVSVLLHYYSMNLFILLLATP